MGVVLLLVPSWIFYFTIERDLFDTEHPLFFFIPDLFENPLKLVVALFITPLVNTETDQVLLITGFAIGRAFRRSRRHRSPHDAPGEDPAGGEPS